MVTGLRGPARCHSPGRIRKRRDSPGEFDDTTRSAGSEIAFHVLSANPPPQRSADDELAPLLQRIRARDQAALSELYDRTSSQVYATALNMLRDPDDAEEVVGDIYQQVWEKADSYDPSRGRVIAWLDRADGGGLGVQRRYHAGVDLASRYTILPLQIEDTGLTPSRLQFNFRVIAKDIVEGDLYRDPLVDVLPDGSGWLHYDGRDPDRLFAVSRASVTVAGRGAASLAVTSGAANGRPEPSAGLGIGLLGIFPDNAPGEGDVAILVPGTVGRVFLPWGER